MSEFKPNTEEKPAEAPVEAPDPPPKLTPEGVRRLIARLDVDLAGIAASGVSDAVKSDAQFRISQMKINLRVALTDSLENLSGWVVELAPQFKAITKMIVEAAGTAAPPPTGACVYEGGCIESTSAHCDEIGGAFLPRTACT